MGGSGGSGGTFHSQSPEALQQQIRKAELALAEKDFTPRLTEKLLAVLSVSHHDAEKTSERLSNVKEILKDELTDSFDLRFGGSVAKHTYVDGFSDVDTLLILRSPEKLPPPLKFIEEVSEHLGRALPKEVTIKRGQIAITLQYPDGDELQLVPAVRNQAGLHVPAWESNTWSPIKPDGFRKKLTKINDNCSGKLVPTIKLAKAINATLPEAQRLSGYHVESLAIDTFKNYDGPRVVEKMLPHLFRTASRTVLAPIKDSTGQSVHVDEYLGAANSKARQAMSLILDRISRRMENATASQSMEQWSTILGE
jgi:hypothetical protein